jgi:dTDP-4-dehydrorhamnose reductase
MQTNVKTNKVPQNQALQNKAILVIGKSGQVGQALGDLLIGMNATFIDREEADFMKPEKVVEFIATFRPDVVINTSAYTAVDKAEAEPEAADLVNHQTPAAIARWVKSEQKTLVHYSTDYVFDGSGSEPRSETAPTGPLSVYGQTKLAGDQAILQSGAKALILRTSWVYSHVGHNFLKTMLRLGAEREELSIVNDQIGSPTYAPDLAAMTLKMLGHPHLSEIFGGHVYNVCGTDYCSWAQFAGEIFRLAPRYGYHLKVKSVQPIATLAYPTPAKRPLNSRLSQEKLLTDFGLLMPSWRDSLERALERLAL